MALVPRAQAGSLESSRALHAAERRHSTSEIGAECVNRPVSVRPVKTLALPTIMAFFLQLFTDYQCILPAPLTVTRGAQKPCAALIFFLSRGRAIKRATHESSLVWKTRSEEHTVVAAPWSGGAIIVSANQSTVTPTPADGPGKTRLTHRQIRMSD